jgi:formylglycine-generating enzyme required for sulfatase activity/serine/threonine protein kinase
MAAPSQTHPTDTGLHAYALGKLDDRAAELVVQHLKSCEACRQRVAELSADSFLGGLRDALRTTDGSTLAKSIDPAAAVALTTEVGHIPPELIGHPQFEVLRELGRGGMGIVYLAHNRLMDRLEVLKVLNKDLLDHGGVAERFLREIRSAARLNHPNIVIAYSALPIGHLVVLAMEYVEGQDLAKMVKSQGPLPVDQACNYAYQTAMGLQHAHENGMVHRDIKPHNLMLAKIVTEKGVSPAVKVLDFGLAKATSEKAVLIDLTGSNQMLGTPDYMAPEQALDAQKADIRADIYALGCTLYFLLTGKPPFAATSLANILLAHQQENARPLNLVRPDVPVEVAAIVGKMLAKDPRKRYQTPGEVARELAPFFQQEGKRPTKERIGPARAGDVTPPTPPSLKSPDLPLEDLVDLREPQGLVDQARRLRVSWALVGVVLGVLLLAVVVGYVMGLGTKEKGPDLAKRGPSEPGAPAIVPSPKPGPPSAGPPTWSSTKAGDVQVVRIGNQEVRFHWCPPGTFTMGSPNNEKDRYIDEDQVSVTLTKGYWMMETEVTQGLWQAAGGPKLDWSTFGGSPELPVYNVSHTEAEEFATKLTRLLHEAGQLPSGMKMALPTEAQWGYAARAGSKTRFSFGDDEGRLGEYAWFVGNSGNQIHAVGSREPNDWGLRDMAGNVNEWCADGFGAKLPGGVDPRGPSGAPYRVFRGGGWGAAPRFCRSANRDWNLPDFRILYLGFRVAAVQAEPAAPEAVPVDPPARSSPAWRRDQAGDVHVVRVGDQDLRFRWCPPGTFTMGSPEDEKDRDTDEDQVEVTLTKGFWMTETEVTQGLWQAAGGPKLDWSRFGGSPDLPVYNVSHLEAEEFASMLTRQLREAGQLPNGMKVALPTEAQWEYAARAGSKTRFSFGDDEVRLGEYTWFVGNSGNKVHAVGSKNPNDWGLRDMAGNMWEWCSDGYGDKLPGGVDPCGPSGAGYRVNRGGSWYDLPRDCRSANRRWFELDFRDSNVGFRVAAVQE